jgi:hypothetical protein
MSDNIQIIKANSGTGIIRVHVGEAEFDTGEKIELSHTLRGDSVITLENGDILIVPWDYIIDKALQFYSENGGKQYVKRENPDE